MPKVTVSCVHGVVESKILESGFSGSLIVRSTEYIMDCLIYQYLIGKILRTPNRARGNPTVREPLNPFCSDCAANFVNRLVNTHGLTQIRADEELCNLRYGVIHKLNHDLHLHYDGDVDCYNYDVKVLIDQPSMDMQEIVARMSELEHFRAAQPLKNFDAAVKALERVEDDKLLEDDCPVCLSGMLPVDDKQMNKRRKGMLPVTTATMDSVVFKLPCQHAFHNTCIRKWFFSRHFSCPLCRFNLKLPNSSSLH